MFHIGQVNQPLISQVNKKESYESVLSSKPGFINPTSVNYLCDEFGIGSKVTPALKLYRSISKKLYVFSPLGWNEFLV